MAGIGLVYGSIKPKDKNFQNIRTLALTAALPGFLFTQASFLIKNFSFRRVTKK